MTLLGDAAHPMLPFMGQGAAQSIKDAPAVARCLAADRDDPQRVIGTYAARRRDRTAAMQGASREQGCDLQLSDSAEIAAPKHGDARKPGSTTGPIRLGLGVRRRDGHR